MSERDPLPPAMGERRAIGGYHPQYQVAAGLTIRALRNGAAASIVIPFTALYPLITVLLAFVFLGETLTLRQCFGAVLAIGGGALLSYEPPA